MENDEKKDEVENIPSPAVEINEITEDISDIPGGSEEVRDKKPEEDSGTAVVITDEPQATVDKDGEKDERQEPAKKDAEEGEQKSHRASLDVDFSAKPKKTKSFETKNSEGGKKLKSNAPKDRKKSRELDGDAVAAMHRKGDKKKPAVHRPSSSEKTASGEALNTPVAAESTTASDKAGVDLSITVAGSTESEELKVKRGVASSDVLASLRNTPSIDSGVSGVEIDEDGHAAEVIVWEWEQELDEYDEPDVYPSEKDYIMVPTQVEIADDDEEEEEGMDKSEEIGKELESEEAVKEHVDGTAEQDYILEFKSETTAETVLPPPDGQEVDSTTAEDTLNDTLSRDVIYDAVKETVMEKVEEVLGGKSLDQEPSGEEVLVKRDGGTPAENVEEFVEESRVQEDERTTTSKVNETSSDYDVDQPKVVKSVERRADDDDVEAGEHELPQPQSYKSSEKQQGEQASTLQEQDGEATSEQEKRDQSHISENEEDITEAEAVGGQRQDVVEKTPEGQGSEEEVIDKGIDDPKEKKEKKGEKADEGVSDTRIKIKESGDEALDVEWKEGEGKRSAQFLGQEGEAESNLDGGIEKDQRNQEQQEQEQSGKLEGSKSDEEKKDELRRMKARRSTLSSAMTIIQEADKASVGTAEGLDPADEFGASGLPEAEPEPDEPKPKRYKTVMVRTLVPRPPKCHYVPEEERKTHITNDKHVFRKRPISLVMSYGYDCQRMANLHVLDKETVVFMSGFVLTFFNHKTKGQTYLRCIGGSCFGALAIHPSRRLFAAAEKGEKPIIGIWSWPKLQLFRKLREGTDKVYASVNFSPCGRLLASQGGEPDYLITVYNWLAEMPVVRVKSHAQDVFRVTFSKELAGRLTTAGLCHIKFWKMATTFTGLKLKGDIGRFGRTELSDIEGYVEMPDGKVLSGTEWGNLLLWENGLIVAEICIRPDIPCHEGIVRHIAHVEGDFYTTGQDGWLRSWPFDTIDAAEVQTTEESLKVAVKSCGQVLIKENSDIWYIVPDISDESSSSVFWFAQDGKGSIIRADLSFLNTAKEPYTVLTAHGGPIVGCAASRTNCIMATLGVDGQIRVYDYIRHQLLACRTFSAAGSTLIWPDVSFDPSGCTILAGFADGTFRVVLLSGEEKADLPMSLVLQQVRKPHSGQLTCLSIDSNHKYLASGGNDGTIFIFDVAKDYLPLFFIAMPNYKSVVSFRWTKPEYKERPDEEPLNKIIAALDGGTLVEFLVPKEAEFDSTVSYFYPEVEIVQRLDFASIKSELLHNEELELERLVEERLNEALEAENRKLIEDGFETASQQNIRLLEEAEEKERIKEESGPEEKWQPYIPPVQSPITVMIPSAIDHNEVFLFMGGYDTGYLYMMRFGESDPQNPLKENPQEPMASTKIEDSKDKAITAFTMTNEGDYIFLGFSDGRVRVQNVEYPYALENIEKHWTEGIHDCVRGQVTSLCLDKDGVFLITTGADGNCFLLSRMLEKDLEVYMKKEVLQPVEVVEIEEVADIADPNAYTLEVYKTVEKEMALLAHAKKNKTAKREEIARLRIWYHEILKRNHELPEEVRLTPVELALTTDKEARRKTDFEAALKQLKIETAWYTERAGLALEKVKNYYKEDVAYELFELTAFNSCCSIWSFRISKLPLWFDEAKDKVETHITPHSFNSDIALEDISASVSETTDTLKKPEKTPGMTKFQYQKVIRIWQRKQKKITRAREWKEFLRTEPKSRELKEEDKAIDEARANLGDMKLKSALDYKVPESKKLTEHRARSRLVKLEDKMYILKEDFNEQMLKLRQEKVDRLARMRDYRDKIVGFQKKLSDEDIIPIPEIKAMVISEDPTRTLSYTVEEVKEYKRQIEEKLKAAAPAAKVVKKQEGIAVKRKATSSAVQKTQTAATKTSERNLESSERRSLDLFIEDLPEVLTPFEEKLKRTETIKAKFWQNHYVQKIEEEKTSFDGKLILLRHRKLKLDFLLKVAEQRMALLTQEFILAQQSEALEASLETKIHDTSKEKRECSGVLKSLNKKLENIKKEMDTCVKHKNHLFHEVVALAASRAPAFEKYLTRVFHKKIPKSRSRTVVEAANQEYDSDEEESSDESDFDMDLSEDEDDGLDIDFPPSELNKEVYDSVVEIRQRRFKYDESEANIREQMEEVNLSMAHYRQKVVAADREFEKARRELDGFRKEKQEKQNELDIAVSLRLHQIAHLDRDLSNVLVTENAKINHLRQRIPELQREKIRQKQMGFEMKRLNVQLHEGKLQFLRKLQVMGKQCDQEMVKKFGQIRPVEELEFFTSDARVVTLKQELKALEDKHLRETQDLLSQIGEAHSAKAQETMNSISRLQTVAHVTARVHSLNKSMEEQMSKLPSELESTLVSREIAFLKILLTDQWNTISALSLEIAQLTQKSTQPLPPIKSIRDSNSSIG